MKSGNIYFPSLTEFFVASIFLNVLLNFNYPTNQFFSWQLLRPSLDVWLLLVLLAIGACVGKRFLFWVSLPVWILFLVLRLFRIGDTAVPMFLNRQLNLYIDSGYLFGLYDLLKTSSRQGDFLLMSIIATVAALGIVVCSWYAWQTAASCLLNKQVRLSFLIISVLLLGVTFIWGVPSAQKSSLVRLGQEILSIQHQLDKQHTFFVNLEKISKERGTEPFSLTGLQGADVLLFVVESYGHVLFSQSRYRPKMESIMTTFAKVLDQHGFMVVSSYLVSPSYGGSSWLAHSTLEFGLRVENDLEDTALLRSSLPPLASYFEKSGYRTVSVMPGTRYAFPEGASFGYEQEYYLWHFNYHGPTFGWAPMSDQFVLDWIRRHEFIQHEQPFFVRYVLISTHAAFSIQPPFIADWDIIGDGSIYHDRQLVYYPIHWPNLKNAGNAYLRSLDYEFETLGDYLAHYVSTDTLIIIIGDHQPNLQLTGPAESWSVPVHIISQNPRLLEPFRKRGYTSGLIPDQPPPNAGMETFFQGFIQDFRQ